MTVINRPPAPPVAPDEVIHVPALILTDEGDVVRAHPLLRSAINAIHPLDHVTKEVLIELVALDDAEAETLVRQLRAFGVLRGEDEDRWSVGDGGLVYRDS